MAFDYKKEYKEFYMPKSEPTIVTIPKMNYIAVRGAISLYRFPISGKGPGVKACAFLVKNIITIAISSFLSFGDAL